MGCTPSQKHDCIFLFSEPQRLLMQRPSQSHTMPTHHLSTRARAPGSLAPERAARNSREPQIVSGSQLPQTVSKPTSSKRLGKPTSSALSVIKQSATAAHPAPTQPLRLAKRTHFFRAPTPCDRGGVCVACIRVKTNRAHVG